MKAQSTASLSSKKWASASESTATDSAEESDKASSPPAAARVVTWWRLLWCHERCHKQECDVRRVAIGEAAKEVGASLMCLKKATKFATWLEQAQCPPFALLTDWREVKPCLWAAALHPPRCQPAFTIVLADMPRHFERASAWAQALPPRPDPVHIISSIDGLRSLLAEMVDEYLSGAALRSRMHAPATPTASTVLTSAPSDGSLVAPSSPFSSCEFTPMTRYSFEEDDIDEDEEEERFRAARKQRDSMYVVPQTGAVRCAFETRAIFHAARQQACPPGVWEAQQQLHHSGATFMAFAPAAAAAPWPPSVGTPGAAAPGGASFIDMSPLGCSPSAGFPQQPNPNPFMVKQMLLEAMPEYYED